MTFEERRRNGSHFGEREGLPANRLVGRYFLQSFREFWTHMAGSRKRANFGESFHAQVYAWKTVIFIPGLDNFGHIERIRCRSGARQASARIWVS
jgi:hypothetical protein